MANEIFSYKEAIDLGWSMTRKYWQPLLLVAFIYLTFQIVGGVIEHFAGQGEMSRKNIESVYNDNDKDKGDRFYAYLQEAGYIDERGNVQSELRDMAGLPAMALPPEFNDERFEIYDFLDQYRYRLPFPKPVYYLLTIILWLIGMVIMIGCVKIALAASRDQKPSVSELYTNWDLLIPYVLGSICYYLACMGGFLLLIIPGIILSIMLSMYSYLIIDRGLGPIASLKRSREITRGSRARLFVFGLLLAALNIAGFLCLVVGVFFTMWISSIAMAFVYRRLEYGDEEGAATEPEAAQA